MNRRIAILHHPRSFFPLDLRDAIGTDIEVIWVLTDARPDRTMSRLLHRLGEVVDIADLDVDAAAGAVAERSPGGIVTFVDDNLELAAALAGRLGLPYHTPSVARTLADKRLQRQALADGGVPGPQFWDVACGLTPADLRTVADEVCYPAVLKPAHGSASRGIVALECPDALLTTYDPDFSYVIEQYLEDTNDRDVRFASYLSVESIVSESRISHVAICGRFPLAPPFRETGNFIPASLGPKGAGPLFEITEAAVRALDITTGVLHTEIKLTDDGPKLIEVNGRLGGRPPFVLQAISDVNLFRDACELALGKHIVYDTVPPTRAIGYWRMIQPPLSAHRIVDVRGLDAVANAAHVLDVRLARHAHESVELEEGTDGCVAIVRGCVADLDDLVSAIAFVDRTIEIDYDRDPVAAALLVPPPAMSSPPRNGA